MTDQEYQDLLNHANNWRYLMTLASQDMTKDQLFAHHKATTKGDLDAWLMKRFGLDAMEARTISNYSMDNIDYRIGDHIRWTAKRPAPTWEDYPELLKYIKQEQSR
jgi:predicted lipid carrier protein YhbT